MSSRKFNAGVQGKSVVIIQVPKETRATRKVREDFVYSGCNIV